MLLGTQIAVGAMMGRKRAKRPAAAAGGGQNGEKEWIGVAHREVAGFFGVSVPTIGAWVKHGMPGRRGWYDLSAIYRWLQSRETADRTGDPLEMQRLEQAKILRIRRLEMEGQLVSVASIHEYLMGFAKELRGLGDQLQRDFGAEAGRLVNERIDGALDQLERAKVAGDSADNRSAEMD